MLTNKKVLIPGIVVVLLVVGGYWFMFMKSSAAPKSEAELKKTEGPIYQLPQEFVVNLSGDSRGFAKIGVALHLSEFSAGEMPAAAEGSATEPAPLEDDPVIRDIVIGEAQKATADDLRTERGRGTLKRRIKTRINKETELVISDIYWTDFAVQ